VRWLCLALLVGCSSREEPATADTAFEEEDVADALPPLDPGKCGTVTGDEAPMVLDRTPPATLRAKLFPFLSALEADAALLAKAAKSDRYTWTNAEAAAAADAFPIDKAFIDRMRTNSAFNAHLALADDAFARRAIVDELMAATNAINAFLGELTAEQKTKATSVTTGAFFQPAMNVALAVLEAADRAQAAKYEPLVAGENAAALAAIPAIDWKKFPFAADVVPGLGGSDLTTPLVEGGRQRCDLALARFAAGLAPLIVVSGGHVHPDRTPFSEAIEMKKYLLSKGIAPSAILVDPHARHTTTNLRNTSRLLLRYDVPPDKPVLLTSDAFQSLYMIGRPFEVRCREEIGFVPWRKLTSLSINDACFFPSRISLTQVPSDPRDP
jgi:hypothetical protein